MEIAASKKLKFTIALLFLTAALLPGFALAQGQACVGGASSSFLCNGLFSLGGNLKVAIGNLLAALGIMVGTLAIVMVVLSGARMLLSQGDPDQIKKGRQGLLYSIGGFAISLLAFVIVAAIENFIGATTLPESAGYIYNPLSSNNFQEFTSTILTNFFGFLGLLAILMIILSGYRYVTSAGNEEQVKKAKESLTWAIIGLVVILAGYIIIEATANFLGRT